MDANPNEPLKDQPDDDEFRICAVGGHYNQDSFDLPEWLERDPNFDLEKFLREMENEE